MPTYRIVINGEPTENLVTENSYMDAYFSATKIVPNAYRHDFKLEKVVEE